MLVGGWKKKLRRRGGQQEGWTMKNEGRKKWGENNGGEVEGEVGERTIFIWFPACNIVIGDMFECYVGSEIWYKLIGEKVEKTLPW